MFAGLEKSMQDSFNKVVTEFTEKHNCPGAATLSTFVLKCFCAKSNEKTNVPFASTEVCTYIQTLKQKNDATFMQITHKNPKEINDFEVFCVNNDLNSLITEIIELVGKYLPNLVEERTFEFQQLVINDGIPDFIYKGKTMNIHVSITIQSNNLEIPKKLISFDAGDKCRLFHGVSESCIRSIPCSDQMTLPAFIELFNAYFTPNIIPIKVIDDCHCKEMPFVALTSESTPKLIYTSDSPINCDLNKLAPLIPYIHSLYAIASEEYDVLVEYRISSEHDTEVNTTRLSDVSIAALSADTINACLSSIPQLESGEISIALLSIIENQEINIKSMSISSLLSMEKHTVVIFRNPVSYPKFIPPTIVNTFQIPPYIIYKQEEQQYCIQSMPGINIFLLLKKVKSAIKKSGIRIECEPTIANNSVITFKTRMPTNAINEDFCILLNSELEEKKSSNTSIFKPSVTADEKEVIYEILDHTSISYKSKLFLYNADGTVESHPFCSTCVIGLFDSLGIIDEATGKLKLNCIAMPKDIFKEIFSSYSNAMVSIGQIIIAFSHESTEIQNYLDYFFLDSFYRALCASQVVAVCPNHQNRLLRIEKGKNYIICSDQSCPNVYDVENRLWKNIEQEELVVDENMRICPNCHAIIERISGCDSMGCRCGKFFCWICAKDNKSPIFKNSQESHAHLLVHKK